MSSTIILGNGIIGASTAYYLSDHQPASTIHLVEPSLELFSSASGFAGGFLAKDWFGRPVVSLGSVSYEEHRRLAQVHGGRAKWAYSASASIGYTPPSLVKGSRRRGDDWLRDGTSRTNVAPSSVDDAAWETPAWLHRQAGDRVELIAADDTTAQLDPLQLCHFLLQQCLDRGVQLHHPARAISMRADVRGELASVRIADTETSTESDIPCTRVIITAGAWSGRAFKTLFPHSGIDLPISSLAGHSLIFRSPRWTKEREEKGCHAVYATSPAGYSPEIYSRLGGDLYIAGVNSSTIPLPELPADRKISSAAIERLSETARELLGVSSEQGDLEMVREGLCFRPVTPWGHPIVCRIPDEHLGGGVTTRPGADGGVFVAAGHGPWGISLSLGTGMVLAEMVQGRSMSADVSGLTMFPLAA